MRGKMRARCIVALRNARTHRLGRIFEIPAGAPLETADRIRTDAGELGEVFLRDAGRGAVFLEQIAERRRGRNRHPGRFAPARPPLLA